MQITEYDKAYIACILDHFGNLNIRTIGTGTRQPVINMYGGKKEKVMEWMGEITNTTAIKLEKAYSRHNCTEHCPDRHADAVSHTMRWTCTGIKATIVLYNILPYMKERRAEAWTALQVGLSAHYKEGYVEQMADIGWDIPLELDPANDVTNTMNRERDNKGRFVR